MARKKKQKTSWEALEKRFIKQTDGISCGAVAIVNTMRVYGVKVPLRTVKKTLRVDRHKGSYLSWFLIGIRKYFKNGWDVWHGKCRSIKRLDSELKKGPVMLLYMHPELPGATFGHVITILCKHGRNYVVSNIENDEKLSLIRESYIKACLDMKVGDFPFICRVTKIAE